MTSSEQAEPDWRHLWERSEANRKRSRRALIISVIGLALVLGALVGVGVFAASFRDVPELQRKQSATLDQTVKQGAKLSEIVTSIQQAGVAQQTQSKATAGLLALTLDLLADNFATPPAPDPGRLAAVQGLRNASTAICASLPAPKPAGCPAP